MRFETTVLDEIELVGRMNQDDVEIQADRCLDRIL
jgi:hypothetical protein